MEGNETNNLELWIHRLIKRPINNCLILNSKGNQVYILKDSQRMFYILIVPNSPFDDKRSFQIINMGYKEKFNRRNYSKFIIYDTIESIKTICSEIVEIFNTIFEVELTRLWRIEISSGWGGLKKNEPLLTKSEIRQRNRTRCKLYRGWKIDFILSPFIGIMTGVAIYADGEIFKLNLFLSIVICSFFWYIILRMTTILRRHSMTRSRNRWFSEQRLAYFKGYGFERAGERFTGKIKGFKTEIFYNEFGEIVIAVHHNEILWENVIKLSGLKRKLYKDQEITWRSNISRKIIKYHDNGIIVGEALKFIEKLVELEITPKQF